MIAKLIKVKRDLKLKNGVLIEESELFYRGGHVETSPPLISHAIAPSFTSTKLSNPNCSLYLNLFSILDPQDLNINNLPDV